MMQEAGEIGIRRVKTAGSPPFDIIYLTEYQDSEGNEIKQIPATVKLRRKRNA